VCGWPVYAGTCVRNRASPKKSSSKIAFNGKTLYREMLAPSARQLLEDLGPLSS
jgi:hypothetical protein